MDRVRWYFDQLVTDGELNLAFDQVEQADQNLASDLGLLGIISGAVAVPHQPLADLSVDLTAPGRAYDRAGRRVFLPAPVTVNLAVDSTGIPTDVVVPGQERWLSIFLRFLRVEHDPRTDGNSQQVNFRQDQGAEVVVRQGAEAPGGGAARPPLDPAAVLVCDVRRTSGQTQVVAADIDTTRRQDVVMAMAAAVGAQPGLWHTLQPVVPTVQASLDAADLVLTEHLMASARRHTAAHIDATAPGYLTETTVQGLLAELVAALSSSAAGSPGASRVGADAVAAAPHSLAPGTVDSQLQQLLGHVNAHLVAPVAAHAATAVAAAPHAYVQGTNVQAQLEEVVADLATSAGGQAGASRVGLAPITGSPIDLPAQTVQGAIETLLGGLNNHLAAAVAAHAASAIAFADTPSRYVANNAEAALDEVMRGFEADHVRPNQGTQNAGWHRTIRQPVMSLTGRALLWESRGAGNNAVFRMYAVFNGVQLTINAEATDTGWRKDAAALDATSFELNQSLLLVQSQTGPQVFSIWPRAWRLVLSGQVSSGWEVAGQVTESGRLSCEATNTATTGRTVTMGGTVNLRSRLLGPPSSITLQVLETSAGFVGTPTINNIDRDGFAFQSSQFLAAGAHGRWVGRYTVTA